jgi:hypothetical protein
MTFSLLLGFVIGWALGYYTRIKVVELNERDLKAVSEKRYAQFMGKEDAGQRA